MDVTTAKTRGERRRVLLIDDHHLFRTGLRQLLEDEGYVVADAPGADVGLRQCRTFRPDVAIVDMHMPGVSGIEATARLREEHADVAVLMLTVAADDEDVLEAIRAGASGYLLKEAHLPEIVAAVEAAAAGRAPISPHVAGALVASVRRRPSARAGAAALASLTDRERAVLALLAEGHDNPQIAARLFVSPSTVKNHISHLLEKLGLENRVQAAAFAIRNGLDDARSAASPR